MRARSVATLVVLACSVLFCGLSPAQDGTLRIYCIQTGISDGHPEQGDATLVIFPDDTTLLIDGGAAQQNGASSVFAQLNRIIPDGRIDYMVVTHWHDDHYPGLMDVALHNSAQYMPGTIYDPGDLLAPFDYADYTDIFAGVTRVTPDVGDVLPLDPEYGASATFVSVNGHTIGEDSFTEPSDPNDQGIGLHIRYGTFDYLTLGDLEETRENALGAALDGAGIQIDVLRVSHHGSDSSTNDPFLASVQPEFAVISCGNGNDYEHPDPDAIARLSDHIPDDGKIFCLERGILEDPLDSKVVIVGSGDPCNPTKQGSLLITADCGGDSFHFRNEGWNTWHFSSERYPTDEAVGVCLDPIPVPPTAPGILIDEGFNTGGTVPPEWTIEGSSATISTTGGHSCTQSVRLQYNGSSLTSPDLTLSGIGANRLVFWYRSSGTTGTLDLLQSTPPYDTWTKMLEPDLPATNSWWDAVSLQLDPPESGDDIRIRFQPTDRGAFFIDDVMLTCAPTSTESCAIHMELKRGWNLISYPATTTRRWNDVLAGAAGLIPPLYTYDSGTRGYIGVPLDAVPEPDKGYWLLASATAVVDIALDPADVPVREQRWTLGDTLHTGWNLIGSVYRCAGATVPLPTTIDGGILIPPVYAYEPATRNYTVASQIAPGVGYWVLFDGRRPTGPACGISIGEGSKSSGTSSRASAGLTAAPAPPPPPGGTAPKATPTPTKAPTKKPAATPTKAPLLKTTALR